VTNSAVTVAARVALVIVGSPRDLAGRTPVSQVSDARTWHGMAVLLADPANRLASPMPLSRRSA
jgi:hypothetical protein